MDKKKFKKKNILDPENAHQRRMKEKRK